MAVELDTGSIVESIRPQNDTNDPYNVSVTVPAGCRAMICSIIYEGSTTDFITGVSAFSQSFTRVDGAFKTGGEDGSAIVYFLGSNISTGAQTVAVDLNNTTSPAMQIVVTCWTADDDCEVVFTGTKLETVTADPQISLTLGGRACASYAALHSGHNHPTNDLSTITNVVNIRTEDWGLRVALTCRFFNGSTSTTTSDHSIGWTAANEDVAMVAFAFGEVQASSDVLYSNLHGIEHGVVAQTAAGMNGVLET